MVLDLRWRLRLGAIAAAFAMGGIVSGQDTAPTSLQVPRQRVSQRTAEWNLLAASLEQRVARLLPCDPQARAAIEEVSRASEARTIALTSYWTTVSIQSKTQIEALRGLMAREQGRAGDWGADASEARVDVDFAAAQGASLATGIPRLPALATPRKDLEAIAEEYRSLEKQAQERAAGGSRILDDLRELLKTSQARQAAIDERLRTVAVEGQRWSAYYAARLARAQIECSLVNPATVPAPSAIPRPTPQGKKQ